MKGTLKIRLIELFCTLFIVIVVVWGFFYAVVYHFIYQNAERQLSAATNQITGDLNREFSAMEKLGYGLSHQPAMVQFLGSEGIVERVNMAAEVETILHGSYNVSFVSDVVALLPDGSFYRFVGDLSNASCALLTRRVQTNPKLGHVVLDTSDRLRLGCVTTVYGNDGQSIGHLILMTDEEKLRELMYSYAFDGFLTVGIAAENFLVSASDALLQEIYEKQLDNPQSSAAIIQKQMGLTPFYAVAALDTKYLNAATVFFTVAAIVTLLAFALVIAAFVRTLQKLFVRPMLGLMENARQIGAGVGKDRLSHTGQEEFDQLVEQINSMISRLEENSRTLFEMQYKMQNVELEKQRAIIISLKKQINAHFTVNTLNVVKRLNEIGENEKAGEMCDGLSSLLRYANGAGEFIGGLEEIRVLEQYVDIMLIRYPGRFIAAFDVEDELDDVMLPRMLVQPIIENAIVHGLLPLQYGKLSVSAKIKGDLLIFKVQNDGRKIPSEVLAALREKICTAPSHPWNESGLDHIALPNIQKRVVSVFGDAYGLTVESTAEQGTTVTLTLPAYPDSNIPLIQFGKEPA